MKRRGPIGEDCFYCGAREGLEADHIPPKCVFPRSARSDIPAFNACRAHNASWKKEDEAFRDVLITYCLAGSDHPALEDLRASVARAEYSRHQAGRKPSITPIRETEGRQYAEIDARRLDWMTCRTTVAMHLIETNAMLDSSCQVGGSFLLPNEPETAQAQTILTSGPARSFAQGAFRYVCLMNPGNPSVSEWIFCYYGTAYFYGHTQSKGALFHSAFFGRPMTVRVTLPRSNS